MPRKSKAAAVKSVNNDFNSISKELTTIADKMDATMPLFATSLRLSIDILKTYQEAFNAINNKKT